MKGYRLSCCSLEWCRWCHLWEIRWKIVCKQNVVWTVTAFYKYHEKTRIGISHYPHTQSCLFIWDIMGLQCNIDNLSLHCEWTALLRRTSLLRYLNVYNDVYVWNLKFVLVSSLIWSITFPRQCQQILKVKLNLICVGEVTRMHALW